jgi:hypothetical protein
MVALGGLVEVTVQDLAERWTSLLNLFDGECRIAGPRRSRRARLPVGLYWRRQSDRGQAISHHPAKLDRRGQVGLPPLCRAD